MTILFAAWAAGGVALVCWAAAVNPYANALPEHRGLIRTRRGPYRWMAHPIYVGELTAICGLAGLAAGWWNVLAVGLVADLLLTDWIKREER